MEKKLRIQLFDEEGRLMDDRTVSQDPEFSKGPKEVHKGLFRIEFTLETPDDVDKSKIYMDKLVGNLSLEVPKKIKKSQIIPNDPQYRENLLEGILKIENLDQDILIKELRKLGFVFRTWDFLQMVNLPELNIKDRHQDKYEWMIREIRRAKNPKSDKYDPMLVFGIKLMDEPDERVVIYLNGEYLKTIKISIPSNPKEVVKRTDILKFPEYMTPEEREKFRIELRSYENNPEKQISKFFDRWMKWVKNVPNLANPNPHKKDQD